MPAGRTYDRRKCGDKERGYKIFAGYRAHENFGVELGYLAADGYGTSTEVFFAAPGSGNTPNSVGIANSSSDISLFYLAGVGYYPVSDSFSLLGKAGVHRWEKETDVSIGGTGLVGRSGKLEDDGIGLLAGIGAQYDLAALPLSLRAEYEYARLNSSSSLRLLSLSLLFRF